MTPRRFIFKYLNRKYDIYPSVPPPPGPFGGYSDTHFIVRGKSPLNEIPIVSFETIVYELNLKGVY